MIFRPLTGFLRKHGRISKGAQERLSSTDSGEIKVRSTDNMSSFLRVFTIPFRDDGILRKTAVSSSPLIQISSLRRNNDVFTSVICNPLILLSRYRINLVLSYLRASELTSTWGGPGLSHRTPKPFYITIRHQKHLALQENYAFELYQVMVLHLSRVDLTWDSRVRYGRVHFTCSQNIIFLCMKN